MSRQDNVRKARKQAQKKKEKRRRKTKGDELGQMCEWVLPTDAPLACVKRHGNATWTPRGVVFLALLWAWSEKDQLTDAFNTALKSFRLMFGESKLTTYQGMMKVLAKYTPSLMEALWPVLHQRMEEIGGRFWRVGGYVVLGFDGSRSSAARTKSNEGAFCAENYGKGRTARYRKKKSKGMRRKKNERKKPQPPKPQVWVTMLWHAGLRLPWSWRLGPSDASERDHVMEMVEEGDFPEKTLFCGDAGFIGYRFWLAIVNANSDFIVRVGGNVSLLCETADIARDKSGMVLSWPKSMQGKQPPLRLRLENVRIGRANVFLLTSVLDREQLPPEQMKQIYKIRWGIEVEFRGLKQTLQRAKLRCHNSDRVLAELNWSIMAMGLAELFAVKEQLSCSAEPDPAKRSLARAIRAVRDCINDRLETSEPGEDFQSRLRRAVTDSYERSANKAARYRPANPDKQPLGQPKLRKMTTDERKVMRQYDQNIAL